MRHIITIIICLIVMLTAMLFQVVSTEDIVNCYSNAVECLGKSQLTSNLNLIGERYDENDDYTGAYRCNADDVTGRDCIYGGCAIDERKISLKGKVNTESGELKIRVRHGAETEYVAVDKDGSFEDVLEFDSGGNYIIIEYDDFTGEIDALTEYAD